MFSDRYRKWMGMNGRNEDLQDTVSDFDLEGAAETAEGAPAASEANVGTISQAEFDQVKTERDQLIDRMARLQAEFDNARKREAKERADFRDYAIGTAAESFLPVLDNFQLALKAQGAPEQFRAGVELIAKQFEESVKSLGVAPVETVGQQFNPHLHEALGTVETAEFPDGAVVEEVRRGYRIKDRLLRPALVKVASNPSQQSA